VTGAPLWPIEEHPVPPSDVPGERAAPTQPVPSWPPPFARQGIADSDLVSFTPELHARARDLVRVYRLGPLFTPPSLQGTVVLPGWIGGAGWGGMALDSAAQVLYLKATNLPSLARLVPPDPDGPSAGAGLVRKSTTAGDPPLAIPLARGSGLLGRFIAPTWLPVLKPPYGTLAAIDLKQGILRWQVTAGDLPEVRRHPRLRSLRLPPLGVAGAPGPLLTAGGLLFFTGGGRVLYAVESAQGSTVWSWDLGRIGYANPMTYRTAAGRQFVVIATGQDADAELVAFALAPGAGGRR
jgi:quinoprotein glucose dehydrogenase